MNFIQIQVLVLELLPKYKEVDVLIFSEACEVFRLTEAELHNAIKSGVVPALKLGKSPDTWRFSKLLIFDLLIGKWEKGRKTKNAKHDYSTKTDLEKKAGDLVG